MAASLGVSYETVASQQGREHGSWKIYGVASRYQTTGEDTAALRAVVNC
jgi:hypothetical protein